jgi:GAF domain-containing protein
VLPLTIDGHVIGGSSFDFTSPRGFDENDRALLTTLARQCAQAIERARLYDEARREHAAADAARQRADEASQAKIGVSRDDEPRTTDATHHGCRQLRAGEGLTRFTLAKR